MIRTLKIVGYDLLFLVCFFGLSLLMEKLISRVGITGFFIYLMLSLFVYSYFKWKTLTLYDIKARQHFLWFILFNAASLIAFGLILTVGYLLIRSVVQISFLKIYFAVLLFVLLFAGYPIFQIVQILYVEKKGMRQIKQALSEIKIQYPLGILLETGIIAALLYIGKAAGFLEDELAFSLALIFGILCANLYNRSLFVKAAS